MHILSDFQIDLDLVMKEIEVCMHFKLTHHLSNREAEEHESSHGIRVGYYRFKLGTHVKPSTWYCTHSVPVLTVN